MSGYRSVSLNNHLGEFIGEFVRVITDNSHYRGECVRIDQKSNNVLLKNVVKKNDTGWVDVSDSMLIIGHAIESVYIEKSFPFDSNESLILKIEDGSLLPDSDHKIKDLGFLEVLR
ncbi:hypothetical protein [Methanolobus psychrotolerans]|uniref:hypothetical protein n=1 Tax=Methanolobus psychrotolerans TaxID=1874706 RepID=UPI001A91ACE3|nr:hypothetical protein [Methanolobus psychrotolerans]